MTDVDNLPPGLRAFEQHMWEGFEKLDGCCEERDHCAAVLKAVAKDFVASANRLAAEYRALAVKQSLQEEVAIDTSSSVVEVYGLLRKMAESMAVANENFAQSIEQVVLMPIKPFRRELEEKDKKIYEEYTHLQRELEKAEMQVVKARAKRDDTEAKVKQTEMKEESKAHGELSSKATKKIGKKQKKLDETNSAYEERLAELNRLVAEKNKEKNDLLLDFGRLERDRISTTKSFLDCFAFSLKQVCDNFENSVNSIRERVEAIDPDEELAAYAKQRETGFVNEHRNPEGALEQKHSRTQLLSNSNVARDAQPEETSPPSEQAHTHTQESPSAGNHSATARHAAETAPTVARVSVTPAAPVPQSANAKSLRAPPQLDLSSEEVLKQLGVRVRAQAVALYDYPAEDEGEISLHKDETLHVIQQHPSGWWHAVRDGVVGVFPSSYVEVQETFLPLPARQLSNTSVSSTSSNKHSRGVSDTDSVSEADDEHDAVTVSEGGDLGLDDVTESVGSFASTSSALGDDMGPGQQQQTRERGQSDPIGRNTTPKGSVGGSSPALVSRTHETAERSAPTTAVPPERQPAAAPPQALATPSSATAVSASTPPGSGTGSVQTVLYRAKMKYAHTANTSQEVSVPLGEVVSVHREVDPWLYVSTASGGVGYVPHTFAERLPT